MQVIRHPELAGDIREVAIHYAEISERVLVGLLGAPVGYADADAGQIDESLGLPNHWKDYGTLSETADARGAAAAAEWAQTPSRPYFQTAAR